MNMSDQDLRANLVLLGSALGAASGGAIASYAASPKQLGA